MTSNAVTLSHWLFHHDIFDTGKKEGRHSPKYDDRGWLKVEADRPWDSYAPEFKGYAGIGWFRTEATVRRLSKIARLRFEGAGNRTTVWVNGKEAGRHQGPYDPFEFRVERLLKPGRNSIAIRIDNEYADTDIPIRRTDWLKYGGLTRSVTLHLNDGPAIDRASVQVGGDPDKPVARIRGRIIFPAGMTYTLDVTATIRPRPGGPVLFAPGGPVHVAPGPDRTGEFDLPLDVSHLPRWSVREPHLLHVEIAAADHLGRVVDRVTRRFGVRVITWDQHGIRINGEKVWLRGVNMVEEYPDQTCTGTDAQMRGRIRDIRQRLHGNFFRAAHYPHHPRFLDACDELGLLVLAEIPMCYLPASRDLSAQKSNDEHLPWAAANTSTADTTSRALALAETMVWRDAHHPAIVMWSAGNERPADQETTAREIRVIISRLKSLDPTRPVTAVSNRGGADRSLAECDVLCLNEYTGVWGAPFATDTRVLPAMARALSAKLDGIHRLHPDKPVIISEFGCPVFPVPGNRFGTLQLQAGLIEAYAKVCATKSWIIGAAAWCWTDQRINGFTHYPPGALGTVELEVFGLTDLRGKSRPALNALAAVYRRLIIRSPAG